jgi:hypothetical protein
MGTTLFERLKVCVASFAFGLLMFIFIPLWTNPEVSDKFFLKGVSMVKDIR